MSDSSYLTNFISSCLKSQKDLKIEAQKQIVIFTKELEELDKKRKDRLDKLVSLNSIVQSFIKSEQTNKSKSLQVDPNCRFIDLPDQIKTFILKIISLFNEENMFKSAREIMNAVADLSMQASVYSSLLWLSEGAKILSRNQEKGYCRGKKWLEKEIILGENNDQI